MNLFGPKKPKVRRSPQWPSIRKAWLAQHPACAACGENRKVQVHHKMPVGWNPTMELDPTNLITLCEQSDHNDHLIFGHLLDWKSRNPNVETDTAKYLYEKSNRPYK